VRVTVGIDPAFFERELDLMHSIQSGNAIQHHLEPMYYKAMCLAAVCDTLRECSHIQGTFREHSGSIQGTFREHM
jgi:hypothetical protein